MADKVKLQALLDESWTGLWPSRAQFTYARGLTKPAAVPSVKTSQPTTGAYTMGIRVSQDVFVVRMTRFLGFSVRRMKGSDERTYLSLCGWYPRSLKRLGYAYGSMPWFEPVDPAVKAEHEARVAAAMHDHMFFGG